MAIYLHRTFHPTQPTTHSLQLLPWLYARSFSILSSSSFFFKNRVSAPPLITRLPGNLRSALPKAELRGRRVPMKKSWYPYRVGPESDEAWERRVPLNSFDRATWAKQGNISKTSARRAPNWQQLRPYNGLISSRRRSSSGTHHSLPFPL